MKISEAQEFVLLLYDATVKDEKKYLMHDLCHGSLEDSPADHITQRILDKLIQSKDVHLDLNFHDFCGEIERDPITRERRNKPQCLLVCAFRSGLEILAGHLIRYGARFDLIKFEDLSLIYRLQDHRNYLMRLLINAGYRLPNDFDIHHFCLHTDFDDYVCYTGMQVDYYITDKMKFLYKYYTILMEYEGEVWSLKKLSRIAILKGLGLKFRIHLYPLLPHQLKHFMDFVDCKDECPAAVNII